MDIDFDRIAKLETDGKYYELMLYVVPNLTAMLEELGQELPFSTRLLIGTSKFLKSWIWLLVIFVIGIAIFIWRFAQTLKGRFIWDSIKIKVPIFKTLSKKIYLARFAENLKTLLMGGIPILKSLDITASVIGGCLYDFCDIVVKYSLIRCK